MKAKRIFAFVASAIMLFGVGCTKENTPSATTSKCTISLSPDQLTVSCAGEDDLLVTVTSNGDWSVTTNNDAVTVSPTSGSGNGTVRVSVAESSEPLSFYEVHFTATKNTLIEGTDITYPDEVTTTLSIAQYDELVTNVKEVRSVLTPLTTNDVDNWTAVPAELAEKTLVGIVSSDYSGHNISNDNYMTVQDNSTEPHSGLFLSPGSGVPEKYAQGDTYVVSLEGAKYKTYNKVIQLQLAQNAQRIAAQQKLQPIEVTYDKILDYESQYIIIKNCQPTAEVRDLTFADKYNPYFEVINGEKFMVYANQRATIREYTIPSKSGSVAGIGYRYNSTAEIMPCNEGDLQLTESLFKVEGKKVGNFGEITKAGIYEMAEVTVVGVSAKSYVLADANGAMMFAYSGEDSSKIPAIGDKGSLYSTVESYGGVLQFSYPEFTKTGTAEVTLTAEELDAAAFDTLYGNINSVKYVQYVGKLTKNESGYYNVAPASATNKSTMHAPVESIVATLEANLDNYVLVRGFALYIDHNALNVIADKIEAKTVSLISAQDISGVVAEGVTNEQVTIEVENVAGTITATYDGTVVTYANVEGETLTYSVSANDGTARKGWIKLSAEGVEEVTIKVSQKGVASGSGYDKIDSVANLTAGEYYMAAYMLTYTYQGVEYDWTNNPYHMATGAVKSGDLETVPYSYEDGYLNVKADESSTAAVVTLEAGEGNNEYYIKINGKYLYSTQAATNRKLGLGDTPTAWVATENAKGGITITSNGVSLGTAGATSNLLRTYAKETSLKYGCVFFKAK